MHNTIEALLKVADLPILRWGGKNIPPMKPMREWKHFHRLKSDRLKRVFKNSSNTQWSVTVNIALARKSNTDRQGWFAVPVTGDVAAAASPRGAGAYPETPDFHILRFPKGRRRFVEKGFANSGTHVSHMKRQKRYFVQSFRFALGDLGGKQFEVYLCSLRAMLMRCRHLRTDNGWDTASCACGDREVGLRII